MVIVQPHARPPLLQLFPAAPVPIAIVPPVVPPAVIPAARPAVQRWGGYEAFYGLDENPFSTDPSDLKFLYHSAAHDRAAQAMLAAIWRRDGIVVLTGGAGFGKTTLCRAVVEQLDRHTLTSVITEPFTSAEPLLKQVLVDFGVISRADLASQPVQRATREELSTALRDFLSSLAPLQAFAVVIIDDAERLSVDALDEIGVLLEAAGDERLLQVVLAGQPALIRTLRRAQLKKLARRITVRCSLGPLAAAEIAGYVAHRLGAAGAADRVEFDSSAAARLDEISRGVPRRVNLVAERALALGALASAAVIDRKLIDAAAEDLDLAPRFRRAALRVLVAVLVLLFVLGGGALVFVLRDDAGAALEAWQEIPPPPAAPLREPPPALPPPAVP